MINLHSLYAYICVCQFFVVSLHRLSNGKPFSVSGQPFQVSSQKFTIFKIPTQFSSQPFSGLVTAVRLFRFTLISRSSLGHLSVGDCERKVTDCNRTVL